MWVLVSDSDNHWRTRLSEIRTTRDSSNMVRCLGVITTFIGRVGDHPPTDGDDDDDDEVTDRSLGEVGADDDDEQDGSRRRCLRTGLRPDGGAF